MDDKKIKKAMRGAGIPVHIDRQSNAVEPYAEYTDTLFKIIRNFSEESPFRGVNIYPSNIAYTTEARTLFFLAAKYSVLHKHKVLCISAVELAHLFSRGYDVPTGVQPEGKLFVYDFASDLGQIKTPFNEDSATLVRWFIRRYLGAGCQVFLLSDCRLEDKIVMDFWGTGFINNLSNNIQEFKMTVRRT